MTIFVILAAGKGTRLWPITETVPKCMVRVLGKPLLQWIVEGVVESAEKIVLVVGCKKEQVTEFFNNKPYKEKLVFVEQEKQEGTAHALLQAEGEVEEDFVVVNGDNFFSTDELEEVCRQSHTRKTFVFAKKVDDCRNFGVFDVKDGKISGFQEKPKEKKPGLVNLNLFKAPKSFFEFLKKVEKSPRGEYELPDALLQFAKESNPGVLELQGFWSDVGFFWNLIDVNAFAAEHLAQAEENGEVEDGVTVKGNIFVGKGTIVKAPSRIEGPVWIGENCVIGPNAFLRKGTVVENNCHVGASEIKNSVLLSGSNAPHFSYVGDSLLCEKVNLGAGTKIANLRFDDGSVRVSFPNNGKEYDSGRRKLGAVIGAGTKTGINSSVNCGVLIGSSCRVFPGGVVEQSVKSNGSVK
ncbi:MAG: bifunctional sugar-1-phosphate nucleotidylyltransferase/acetyltransferase [Candidatus Micrarchaeia archaeon]